MKKLSIKQLIFVDKIIILKETKKKKYRENEFLSFLYYFYKYRLSHEKIVKKSVKKNIEQNTFKKMCCYIFPSYISPAIFSSFENHNSSYARIIELTGKLFMYMNDKKKNLQSI